MNRNFMCLVAILLLAAVQLAEAQQSTKVPRIGFICSCVCSDLHVRGFQQGLRELRYIDGKNIIVEYRAAESLDNFRGHAENLVRLNVDIIVVGGTRGTEGAKKVTSTIPIVMASANDPVGSGLVASLARPGGSVTGLSYVGPELFGKQIELLKEAVPQVSRIAILWNPANPSHPPALSAAREVSQALGTQLLPHEVRSTDDFEKAFSAISRGQANALTLLRDPVNAANRARIVDFAAKSRLSAIYPQMDFINLGGLMSYGPDISDLYRRAAYFVDKILKGTKPAELPVELPKSLSSSSILKAPSRSA